MEDIFHVIIQSGSAGPESAVKARRNVKAFITIS